MQVEGRITHIGQTETVGSNGFTKRLLVVDTGAQYDPTVPIEFKKDKVALLDNLQTGQTVKVSINLGGRMYNDKYYPSITGWKIEATPMKLEPLPLPVFPNEVEDIDESTLPF